MGLFRRRPRSAGENSSRFTGNYKSWAEAEKIATGYCTPEILEKTRAALLKVKSGSAAFERDSVTFDVMERPSSLLTGLTRSIDRDGRLSVLDFGGSLGSTYFQCRNFLGEVKGLRWSVIDQPAHIACGRAEFANKELRFYETIEKCFEAESPNVLLLLSVLQYLPEPHAYLEKLLERKVACVVIERTAFTRDGTDRLTLQQVPASIYDATLPAWFLSEPALRRAFAKDYDMVSEYRSGDEPGLEDEVCFKGFQFELRNARLPA
jgi:putative methyltransferase (TIGR04325 family)